MSLFVAGQDGAESDELRGPWRRVSMAPGVAPDERAAWQEAEVPGSLGAADGDDRDHWYRLDFALPAGAVMEFLGLATVAEVWVDGVMVGASATMFRPLVVAVPAGGGSRLELCFRALRPRRGMRRTRWRNRLVGDEGWRGVRTSLLGRVPGTGAPIVGPFRKVLLHPAGAMRVGVRSWMEGGAGFVRVRVSGGSAGVVEVGGERGALERDGEELGVTVQVPGPALWWPHTHGEPALVDVAAVVDGRRVGLGRTGFRTVERRGGEGFGLVVNGVEVFCRGAVWMGGSALEVARDAGMNMVRVPGTALYPDRGFFEDCDALGLLVWQDFMFARFDYPADAAFLEEAREEARGFLVETGGHPCVAVLCGGDEVVQAAAMGGRPGVEWGHALFDEVLPGAVAALRPDVPYVANAPSGGALPFGKSAAVAHYFGVGAYLRPVEDAAGVRFAAACLAFANPEEGGEAGAAAARDPGAAWDFGGVRDHYVEASFGVNARLLQRTEPERWLAMGRAAVALTMQAVFSGWRMDGVCGGGLVLALQDVAPGAGLGVVGHDGRGKSALHALAGVFRPVQVLLQDRGLDGVVVGLINEGATDRAVRLVLRGLDLAGGVTVLAEGERVLARRSLEVVAAVALMGRFQDLAGAWLFGPAPFTVVGAMLLDGDGAMLAEATLFPGGAGRAREDLGLEARVSAGAPWRVEVRARRFAQFVSVEDAGCVARAGHFHLWPGEARWIDLRPIGERRPAGSVAALNGLAAAHYRVAP